MAPGAEALLDAQQPEVQSSPPVLVEQPQGASELELVEEEQMPQALTQPVLELGALPLAAQPLVA
jgi:hypothetical protein